MGRYCRRALAASGLVGVLVLVPLSGCQPGTGSPDSGGTVASHSPSGQSPSGGTERPAGPSPGGVATPQVTPSIPGTKRANSTEITVRGQVGDGVEAGCTILTADDGTVYQIIGGDRAVIFSGRRVEVVGRLQPDLMTTCQQGTPLVVTAAHAI